jgi:outer membrane protein assembly factor BamE (lipoprotein component of BamABCDE complex)
MYQRIWGAFCVLFLLAACSSSVGNDDITNAQKLSQIQRGVTTKQQVFSLLGEPKRRLRDAQGKEIWHYSHTEIDVNSASFIPVVGIFFGGNDSVITEVEIEFVDGTTVSNYTTSSRQEHRSVLDQS